MQLVRIDVADATQFVNTTAITTFNEQRDGTVDGPDMAPRILGYAYNSIGDAAIVVLRMSPAVGSAVNEQIVLQTPAAAVNSFTQWCGKGGPIVPRLYGVTNNATQAPDTALGSPNNAAPFVLLFSTTGKTDDGTFYVWYDYVNIGGTL